RIYFPTHGIYSWAASGMRLSLCWLPHGDFILTLVMVHHVMLETSELCDRVAVLDGGRLLTCETPAALSDRWRPEPPRPDTRAHGAAALEAAFLALVGRRPLLAGA